MDYTLYEEKKPSGSLLPLLFSVCFLLLAAVTFMGYRADGKKQAEQIIKAVYTLDTTQGGFSWDFERQPGFVKKRYGKYMTEGGLQEVLASGLPTGLLVGDENGRVERVYAAAAGIEALESWEDGGAIFSTYRYEVEVETRYERGFEVVPKTKKNRHTGVVRLKKEGFSGWKLDGLQVG